MRLIGLLIALCMCAKESILALPVQSKALENVNDQLFWQAAWFSEDNNERAASPFAGDSKRISPKSIFIIPEKSASYCAPGYRIDNGKCIKIVSVHQTSEESKLASLITTDDTANFDYDYWSEDDDYAQQTTDSEDALDVPLVPILNESGESSDDAKKILVKQHEIHSTSDTDATATVAPTPVQTFQNFRHENRTDSVQVIIATLSSDAHGWEGDNHRINDSSSSSSGVMMMTYEHERTTTEAAITTTTTLFSTSVNEFKNSSRNENENENEKSEEESGNFNSHMPSTSTATVTMATTAATTTTTPPSEAYESITERANSNENEATSIMQDLRRDNQNIEPAFIFATTTSLATVENSDASNITATDDDGDEFGENFAYNETTNRAEDAIRDYSFDDVALLQNESLLMTYDSLNISTNFDYDDVTTLEPLGSYDSATVAATVATSSTDSTYYEGSTDDSFGTLSTANSSDEFETATRDFDEFDEPKKKTTEEEEKQEEDFDRSVYKYESYSGDRETENKFVYQHLTSVTEQTTDATERSDKIKFPSDERPTISRVKFPDEPADRSTSPQSKATRFSWPRENPRSTTNIFQYWNQQPLIADTRVRENSKSFRDNFFPYTRTQKVQIVTPQQRRF